MSVLIETKNLGRYFGTIKAVDGINFRVNAGEVLGFLGPNGAGKSTTMKMLTCFLTPSFGTASVDGYDIIGSPREVRSAIGYLPENAPLYGEMLVREFLDFVAEVRSIQGQSRRTAVERVMSLTSIESVAYQRIETLSKGYKRRVGLAQALIHDPKILILDEPTDGLDPNQKHEVRTLIRGMAAEKCIILSTHILEEVDEVCNRAVIIAGGKIVADDTPDGLKSRAKSFGAVVVRFGGKSAVPSAELEKIAGVKRVETRLNGAGQSNFILYPEKAQQIVHAVVKEAERRQWLIAAMSVEAGELDEVFREITR